MATTYASVFRNLVCRSLFVYSNTTLLEPQTLLFLIFPKSALLNCGCGLSTDAAYTRTFTVINKRRTLSRLSTVMIHDGHLRTWGKCRKHEPQASAFYTSWVFAKVRIVLSQRNIQLKASSFALWYRFYVRKTIIHALSMFYTQVKHGFLTNQSMSNY